MRVIWGRGTSMPMSRVRGLYRTSEDLVDTQADGSGAGGRTGREQCRSVEDIRCLTQSTDLDSDEEEGLRRSTGGSIHCRSTGSRDEGGQHRRGPGAGSWSMHEWALRSGPRAEEARKAACAWCGGADVKRMKGCGLHLQGKQASDGGLSISETHVSGGGKPLWSQD